jgi:hypothetical protein
MPLIRRSCFVQFLPKPPLRVIFEVFRLTSNLQILRHLIVRGRVAGQLLYLMCVASRIWSVHEARMSASGRLQGQRAAD